MFADPYFYSRWLTSIFLTLFHHPKSSGEGLVIYPDWATERPPSKALGFVLEHGPIHRVYLEDLLEQRAPTWSLGLLRLLILSQKETPETARELARRLDERPRELTESQAIGLLETFLSYKLPQLDLEGVKAMLHLPDTRLEESAFYQ